MENAPAFSVSYGCAEMTPPENISGFSGGSDNCKGWPLVGWAPVKNMTNSIGDSYSCTGPPVKNMLGFKDSGDSLKFLPVENINMSGFSGSNYSTESPPMSSVEFPLGYRFRPTHEELITHFLRKKIADSSFCAIPFGEADMEKLDPWDFSGVSVGEREWHFFGLNLKDRGYPTGQRINRATYSGYWKPVGKDRGIFKGKTLVGMVKTLVFYQGRAPRGERTDWVLHEYRLVGDNSLHNLPQNAKNEWVICEVFLKRSRESITDIVEST